MESLVRLTTVRSKTSDENTDYEITTPTESVTKGYTSTRELSSSSNLYSRMYTTPWDFIFGSWSPGATESTDSSSSMKTTTAGRGDVPDGVNSATTVSSKDESIYTTHPIPEFSSTNFATILDVTSSLDFEEASSDSSGQTEIDLDDLYNISSSQSSNTGGFTFL